MTYAETLDFLFTRLPMYQRQGASALKKDLTNIRLLLAELDHPERKLRCVHVAGTNGKGTVAHLLAAALQGHGYRVGMYTSPHYRDFRERIKVNGQLIDAAEVVGFVDRIRPAIERIRPSFFEITVAMAFDFFARTRVQWCVVEVGLGGRLDSTNVIDPILSVITNIGLDHTRYLGETLAEIAGEKAGIIKPGRPVVIGERHPETTPVFRARAAAVGAPLTYAEDGPSVALTSDLRGPFVGRNLATARAALEVLAGIDELRLDEAALAGAWRRVGELTYYIGRWQILRPEAPLVIADSAHNAEGLTPVVARLGELRSARGGRLHLVLGVVNDKDLSKALPLFPPEAVYYFVRADVPRGLPAAELARAAAAYGLRGAAHASVRAGYTAARAAARDRDIVFVGGSVFTVAEVL